MKKNIEKLIDAYNSFQKAYGSGIELDYGSIIEKIFSKNFKKVANGKEMVSTRDGLEKQLADVKTIADSWNIEVHYMIPSACGAKCTLRYTLESAKAGDFDVLAVITAHDEKHIDEIDEIYRVIEK